MLDIPEVVRELGVTTFGSIPKKPTTISDPMTSALRPFSSVSSMLTMAAFDRWFRSKPYDRFIRSTVKVMSWLLGASGSHIWVRNPENLVRLMTTLLLHILS